MMILLAAAAIAATPAQAQPVSTYDPETIASFLRAEGYKAQIGVDGEGDPMIESGAAGARFEVYLYNCQNHVRCKDMQFSSGFDYEDGKAPSVAAINEWNRKWRFAKAYLDEEQDPMLQMDVIFTDGQMSAEMFRENLEMWTEQLGAFVRFVGW